MAQATGRCICHKWFRRQSEVEDVVALVRNLYAGRVKFHDGAGEIAPGVTVHLIGGHTGGLQVVRVHTARGWVVLASDAVHYWANIEERNPFPAADVMGALEGFAVVEGLADGPTHIIPGHDPAVLTRFPPLRGNIDIVRVDLAPTD
jgi:glyoxylase-like metal-dependent hydrolase (beta-lactamase superfamily II)